MQAGSAGGAVQIGQRPRQLWPCARPAIPDQAICLRISMMHRLRLKNKSGTRHTFVVHPFCTHTLWPYRHVLRKLLIIRDWNDLRTLEIKVRATLQGTPVCKGQRPSEGLITNLASPMNVALIPATT
jgi:hypothetical protein